MPEPRERPIIFSGPMVRAILDGRKSQTRRVVNPQPSNVIAEHGFHDGKWGHLRQTGLALEEHDERWIRCPYGQPGDRLWVRETLLRFNREPATAQYAATLTGVLGANSPHGAHPNGAALWWAKRRTIPSIHMPRWASRLTLENTGVRVEPLQEITPEDCMAEGIGHFYGYDERERGLPADAVRRYAELWNSINAKRGHPWASSPWVWVLEFRRLEDA